MPLKSCHMVFVTLPQQLQTVCHFCSRAYILGIDLYCYNAVETLLPSLSAWMLFKWCYSFIVFSERKRDSLVVAAFGDTFMALSGFWQLYRNRSSRKKVQLPQYTFSGLCTKILKIYFLFIPFFRSHFQKIDFNAYCLYSIYLVVFIDWFFIYLFSQPPKIENIPLLITLLAML